MTNDQRPTTKLRLAWFSPLPPIRSGVAALSAELVPVLRREFDINFNALMETGGAVVSDKLEVAIEIEAVLEKPGE